MTPTMQIATQTAFKAVSALLKVQALHLPDDLRQQAADLVAELSSGLPERADGQAWTDDDIHAAATAARSPFEEALARSERGTLLD